MIVRNKESPLGLSELVAAFGGAVLLIAVLAPIDWASETSTGGITGQGTGTPPQGLTASDLFGVALAPLVFAAAVPLAEFVLRQLGRSIVAGVRFVSVATGLVALGVGVFIELTRCRRAAIRSTRCRAPRRA